MTTGRFDGSPFRFRVLSVVRRIPPGRVATYGDVAAWAGAPRAARAVGAIMATTGADSAPCHRVIAAGGRLGGYGGQESLKRALLRAEGIRVEGRRIRAFREVRWPGPDPLPQPPDATGRARIAEKAGGRGEPRRTNPRILGQAYTSARKKCT